ncbi:MAG: ribonuclease HII [Hyphomicrobiales bacterium]|nr:ribonuclease HII [Hyphomicrobiales bacterium]
MGCAEGPVAGVDEAGRGPLAGPVVAAAVVLDPARIPDGIDDSKALTAAERERLANLIRATSSVGISVVPVETIDAINILRASLLAMRQAVAALAQAPAAALVDGRERPDLACRVETVIGGDALCLSIAAASIIAKVTRDRLMMELAVRHPGYGWETNMGYATPGHRAALARLGVTPQHRRSFAPARAMAGLGGT